MDNWLLGVKAGELVYIRSGIDAIYYYCVTKVTKAQIVIHPYDKDIRFRRDNGREIGGYGQLVEPTQEVMDIYETRLILEQLRDFLRSNVQTEALPNLRKVAKALGLKEMNNDAE